MKCPKCGYHSFEYLENCRKCGVDLAEHKARFDLGGFYPPPRQADSASPDAVQSAPEVQAQTAPGDDIDFGFDFLDEEDAPEGPAQTAELAQQASEADNLDISQPFNIDGEVVPHDQPAERRQKKQDAESDFEL